MIPTPILQSTCNNVLFDGTCGLIRSVYETKVMVTSISNEGNIYGDGSILGLTNYTADGNGRQYSSRNPSYFLRGVLEYNGEYAGIINSDAGFVQLNMRLSNSVQVGSVVSIYPYCDKNPSTCLNTFNNLTNFVGFPYLPTVDPAKWGITVV
jgi:hypothetical protein